MTITWVKKKNLISHNKKFDIFMPQSGSQSDYSFIKKLHFTQTKSNKSPFIANTQNWHNPNP